MTILVDMDDTIVNSTARWVDYANHRYGTAVRYDDLQDWNVALAFPMLTKEQIYALLYEEAFWRSITPLPGAAKTMSALKEAGHRVLIVTNSHYVCLKVKMEEVLFRYFPFLTWDDVILTSQKQLIRGDVLIDDGVQNLVGGDYEKLLFTQPHNRSFDAVSAGMTRVADWREIAAYFHLQEP